MWDARGRALATTAGGLEGPGAHDFAEGARWRARGSTVLVHLADGRWLAARSTERAVGLGGLLASLGLVFLLIAAGAWPIARRITRRLEALQAQVARFGAGDLTARARVGGKDEVARLATHFNEAADRIEKLVAGQKRVLAHASHELRSPLARLRMGLELIAESADGDKRMARHADATRDIAELDALIGELLLASRLEAAGKRGEALVDVAAVARREAERAEVTFSAEGPVHVRGDEALIARVVRNLIDNALRYGGPKHEVSVSVAGGAGATVVVEDRGPGIPPEYREAIFEPFFRLPGHAEGSDGGVGLGLSLVREISRLHGGDVRCVAREGGGSRFEASFG